MGVNWSKDIDHTLAAAKSNPAPSCWISARLRREEPVLVLDAESYEDRKTSEFIRENLLPVKAHIKEHPAWFHRFDAVWTPTVLLLDAAGKERVRLEGYLPKTISWPL